MVWDVARHPSLTSCRGRVVRVGVERLCRDVKVGEEGCVNGMRNGSESVEGQCE